LAVSYSIFGVIRARDQFTGTLNRIARNARQVGRQMTTNFSVPAALLGGVTLRTAVNFETAMNRVEAKTQASSQEMERMSELARELGATTAFTATQAGEGMAFLAQAGFEVNSILSATPDLLNLAAAAEIDLGRAADIASNIMGQFNLKADETGRVADVLSAVTAGSNVNMEQLADTMKMSGPIAKQFGLSLEDTASAVGLLGNIGVQGTLAGTAMRTAMLRLAAPPKAARDVLDELGVATRDAAGDMRPLAGILTDFAQGVSNLGSGDRLSAIEALFGKFGLAGAAELVNQAEGGGLVRFADQMRGVEGASQRMADTMMKGAPGAVRELMSAIQELMLAIANSGVLEAFTDLARRATVFVRNVSQSNPELFKWGTALVAVGVALGPLVIGAGLLASAIAVIGGAIAVVATRIGPLIAGITALAAGAVTILGAWGPVKDFFAGLIPDSISNFFGGGSGAAAASAPSAGASRLLQGSNTQSLNGKLKIEFENAPAGTRVRESEISQQGVDVETMLGFASNPFGAQRPL